VSVSSSQGQNHFSRLGVRPQLWIEPDALTERFLELSAQLHPDKADPWERANAEREFRSLNESFNILRNTRSRVLHFLELSGARQQEHVQTVPPNAVAFFSQVASVTSRADALLKEKAAASSPMLKVHFMERGMEVVDAIEELQQKLRSAVGEIELRLRSASIPPDEDALRRLVEDAGALGFFDRWQAQLQERIAALTF
jgi:DnaJ-domain-containing protein 1